MLQIFRKKRESQQKQNDQSSQKITSKPHTKAPNATGCPPLVFKGFKIQSPINFTMRPNHVQGRIHLQKLRFLEIWP